MTGAGRVKARGPRGVRAMSNRSPGAIGGKGGEGKATRHFMVRIRIPNGQLQAHQLRTIAGLAEGYARGIADITVRQNIQLHWVTLESLPDVFQTLWRTGITTMGACGDVTRNRSEEHTSELQSQSNLVCRLLLEKKKEEHRSQSGRHLMRNARTPNTR